MSTLGQRVSQVYGWLEDKLEEALEERAPDPAVFHPCEPSASLSLRDSVIKGDISRARKILQTAGRAALDVPRLWHVTAAVVRLGLVPDVLRAGLSAAELTQSEQEIWVRAAVTADRPADAKMLLDAGFAPSRETVHDVRMKGVRSGAWRDVAGRWV